MYECKESDWKLFKKKIASWQEDYMEKLNLEYISLLQREEDPSHNFWNLCDRIDKDKKKPGVVVEMSRAKMFTNLLDLLNDGVITFKDLEDFSEELIESLKHFVEKK